MFLLPRIVYSIELDAALDLDLFSPTCRFLSLCVCVCITQAHSTAVKPFSTRYKKKRFFVPKNANNLHETRSERRRDPLLLSRRRAPNNASIISYLVVQYNLPICTGTVQLRHIAIKYEEKTFLCGKAHNLRWSCSGLVQRFRFSPKLIAHYNRDANSPGLGWTDMTWIYNNIEYPKLRQHII